MRRSSSRSLAAVVVLSLTSALTFALVTSAGATPPDLSTDAAISAYLQSIGVNPLTAVWQGTTDAPSHKNYAGPGCPGSGWNCKPATTPIVQITDAGGTNLFACGGLDCVVVQVALSGGQNGGTCLRGDNQSNNQTQICEITQTNNGNPNSTNAAGISQNIQQSGGSTQNARQVARITQQNTLGKNIAHIHQVIGQKQDVKSGTTITQDQEAHQAGTVDQLTTTGGNSSNITQRQDQSQSARKATTIFQDQNSVVGIGITCDAPSDPTFDQDKNQCADVDQVSDPSTGGTLASDLRQLIKETQSASAAATVTQRQGDPDLFPAPSMGQRGEVDQNSSGVATSAADEDMSQTQTASGATTLSQSQHTGDPRCCQSQFTNPNNTAEITQDTNQQASSGDDAFQTAFLLGECNTSGNCEVRQSATVNDTTETNSCSGQVCEAFVACYTGEGGSFCESGEVPPDDDTITIDAPTG